MKMMTTATRKSSKTTILVVLNGSRKFRSLTSSPPPSSTPIPNWFRPGFFLTFWDYFSFTLERVITEHCRDKIGMIGVDVGEKVEIFLRVLTSST